MNRLGASCSNKPDTFFSQQIAAISVTLGLTCAHSRVSDLFERHCYKSDNFINHVTK